MSGLYCASYKTSFLRELQSYSARIQWWRHVGDAYPKDSQAWPGRHKKPATTGRSSTGLCAITWRWGAGTDWKVGSEIVFQGEYEGHKYRDKGVILENIPNKLISYSYWSGFSGLEDKPENYAVVTYNLTKKENTQTKLTWTQKGYANEEGYKHSESGMETFLEKIKEIVER